MYSDFSFPHFLPPSLVLLTDVVLAEQLHSHHGKDEDDNAEHKGQIT